MNLTKHFGTVVSPANLVTLLRLLLSPVLFAMVLAAEDRGGASWGAFLDPFADKVVVIGVAVCLVMVDRYGWLPVALLAVREVGITLYRLWFVRRGLAVPARRSAKWKTTVQGVALLLAVVPPLEDADLVVEASLWLAVAFRLVTGVQYLADGSRATSTTGA